MNIQCPNCKKDFVSAKKHNYTPKFCSRSCANKRIFSEQTKNKMSEGFKQWWKNTSDEDRELWRKSSKSQEVINKIKETKNRNANEVPWDDICLASKKRRVRKEQNYECLLCKTSMWCGKKLILEVDHIDGNVENNSRQNLRGLCPNCHSQTPTWRKAHRNKRK